MVKAGGKRKTAYLRISLILALFVLLAGVLSVPATSMAAGEIYSQEDFYDLLADQLSRRELLQRYPTPDRNLGKSLVHMDWNKFEGHYNEQEPLKSGCYLMYYVDSITLSYRSGYLQSLLNYKYTSLEMDTHFEKMKKLAVELKGETEFDTVLNVHDYLIKNFEYDQRKELGNHTDIEGFRDGVMVCSGYSLAAYYLLNAAGVKARVITGFGGDSATQQGENHMWNMVQLDGKWYNMDITWDDNGSEPVYTYFLKCDKEFPMHKRLGNYDNSYFNGLVNSASYKLPGKLTGNNLIKYLAFALGVVILLLLITFRKKKANGDERVIWNGGQVTDWQQNIHPGENVIRDKYGNVYRDLHSYGDANEGLSRDLNRNPYSTDFGAPGYGGGTDLEYENDDPDEE